MIRRILVGLSDDDSSKAAADVTLDLAHQFGASVSSLATVDFSSITMAAVSPGFGATYYAYNVVQELESQMQREAKARNQLFFEKARQQQVTAESRIGEGVPWECFEQESFFHDLLVIGRRAHFSPGTKRDPKAPGLNLRRILDEASCPLLCVSQAPLGKQRVLVGLDGRPASSRALQQFLHSGLLPEAEVLLVHCNERAETSPPADLEAAQRYLEAHQRKSQVITVKGAAKQELPKAAEQHDVDMIVLGPHGKSRLMEWALGNTMIHCLGETERAVLVAH